MRKIFTKKRKQQVVLDFEKKEKMRITEKWHVNAPTFEIKQFGRPIGAWNTNGDKNLNLFCINVSTLGLGPFNTVEN